MIGPVELGQQWVRREQEDEQWTTQSPEVVELRKRQLGIEITLGDAVLSVGLDSNGLPAFTLTLADAATTTTPAAVTSDTPANTDTAAPAPTTQAADNPTQTIAAPAPVPTTDNPVNTATGEGLLLIRV
jgi:hypothetical protein